MSEASTRPRLHPVHWDGGTLRILDQTRLPAEEHWIAARDYREVVDAIRRLAVRGAPLIGIAGAYGLALAAAAGDDITLVAPELESTRPTAVNLRWALQRVLTAAPNGAPNAVLAEARRIHDEQVAADARIGALGAELLPPGGTVLTHCNTGTLATGGIGTALGVIKTAHRQGRNISVLVDETRPLLQGARLTAWELQREGIPYRIIADAAAAGLIARGRVQAVIVGADRIAANGDTANKVGTYGLALAAAAHGVPFYVAAPRSTVDEDARDGAEIVVEERGEDEVLSLNGAPAGARAFNPAFDVTPAALISTIITEDAVLRPPFALARTPTAVVR